MVTSLVVLLVVAPPYLVLLVPVATTNNLQLNVKHVIIFLTAPPAIIPLYAVLVVTAVITSAETLLALPVILKQDVHHVLQPILLAQDVATVTTYQVVVVINVTPIVTPVLQHQHVPFVTAATI